jgi:TolB-like protein
MQFAGFVLKPDQGTLEQNGRPIALRAKSFALLSHLVANPNRVVPKAELVDTVWRGLAITDDAIIQTIRDVRRALRDEEGRIIRTVHKRGYMFVPGQDPEAISAPSLLADPGADFKSSAKPSVVILPFTNLSGDPKQDFFAAGLRLDVESALSLIGVIELLSQSAAADFQLSGSVRAESGQIRVTARLVEAAGGRQLWGGRFDGRADDIFALQEEITRQVAVAMQVKLTSGDYARLWHGQTRSLAAWERCVVANQHFERWSEADNRRARDLLREALEIDPDYVAAKVSLAKTWWYDARFFMQGDDREHALTEAERLCREVLGRFPDSGIAMMVLGGAAWLRDRHDEAVTLCRRASSLSPSDAWTLGFFGVISVFSGDLQEALAVLERAARLSPQTFTWIVFHIGHARAWLGDDAGAQASLQRYIAGNPQDTWGPLMLAVIHGFAGRTEEARRAVAEAVQLKADIDQDQVRRSNRYRDPVRLERVIAALSAAGLPS